MKFIFDHSNKLESITKLSDFLTDESKWCQHEFFKTDGIATEGEDDNLPEQACLYGALDIVGLTIGGSARNQMELRIGDYLATRTNALSRSISVWNDAPERTFEDVKKLMAYLEGSE